VSFERAPEPIARVRPGVFDAALATVLTLLLQIQVWSEDGIDETFADRPISSVVLLLVTVPLAWRRHAPIAVAGCCAGGLAGQAVITGTFTQATGLALPALVALYSAAAYAERPRAYFGLAAILAGVGVRESYDFPYREDEYWTAAFYWLLALAVFGAGAFMRGQRQSKQLERQTERLEQEREQREAVVIEERTRIARELHDLIGHSVSAAVVQAEAAEEVLEREPDRARQSLVSIQRTGREALGEMRRLLGIVRGQQAPDGLSPQPGLADLDRLVETGTVDGLSVSLSMEGERRDVPPGIDLSAFRIVQEALTNVRKHAGRPVCARVGIRYEPTSLDVSVVDDGSGPLRTERREGHGLIGMRERVAFFGGDFEAGPRTEGGFGVQASFPLAEAKQ
jgi:signal transduction histidine kinase